MGPAAGPGLVQGVRQLTMQVVALHVAQKRPGAVRRWHTLVAVTTMECCRRQNFHPHDDLLAFVFRCYLRLDLHVVDLGTLVTEVAYRPVAATAPCTR